MTFPNIPGLGSGSDGGAGSGITAPTLTATHIPAGHGDPSVVTGLAGPVLQTVGGAKAYQATTAWNKGHVASGAFEQARIGLGLDHDMPDVDRAVVRELADESMANADRNTRRAMRQDGIKEWQRGIKKRAEGMALHPKNVNAAKIADKGLKKFAMETLPKMLPKMAPMAARGAAVAVPFVGPLLAVGMWCLDSSERKLFNNFVSAIMGPGSAPGLDAAPEPPRTNFLPLTHDGNRDPSIVRMDEGMTQTNLTSFGYHPDDVWPASPNIETTPDFVGVIQSANRIIADTGEWADNLQSSMRQLNGKSPVVDSALEATKPQVDAMGDLGETVLPTAGNALAEAALAANQFYQHFREINYLNRKEINNSTSGIIPLRPNHVNEAHMDDSLAAARDALNKMSATSQKIATAGDNWSVPAPMGVEASEPVNHADQVRSTRPALLDGSELADNLKPGTTNTPGESSRSPLDDLKDKLGEGIPSVPQMPGMPTMPTGGGGSPMGGGMPGGGMPTGSTPMTDPMASQPADLKDMLDKKNAKDAKDAADDEVPGDAEAKDPADEDKVVHAVGASGVPGAGGNPADAPPIADGVSPADNTADIGGKTRTFDSPKAAQMAHLLSMPGEGGQSIEQAASQAGYDIPPPDQDIGEQKDINEIKPGDVIKSQPDSGVYLGDDEVVTEAGEVKPLSDVMAGVDGPHQGIFRLADDGSPPLMAAGADTGPSSDMSMPSSYTSSGDAPAVGDSSSGPDFSVGGGPSSGGMGNPGAGSDPGLAPGRSSGPSAVTPGGVPGGM